MEQQLGRMDYLLQAGVMLEILPGLSPPQGSGSSQQYASGRTPVDL